MRSPDVSVQHRQEDEKYISALIERWAKAVHAGDLDGVLADHASDIVMFDVPHPTREFGASMPIARRGRHSSNGNEREPRSRSSRSTSPLATMSRSRMPFSAAGPTNNSRRIRTTVFDSPSGCASRAAGGSFLTSIIPFHRRELGAGRLMGCARLMVLESIRARLVSCEGTYVEAHALAAGADSRTVFPVTAASGHGCVCALTLLPRASDACGAAAAPEGQASARRAGRAVCRAPRARSGRRTCGGRPG